MNAPRIAVVGAGHLGTIHARLLARRTDARLAAVVDPCSAARERVAEELGIPVFTALGEVDVPVDGVIVAAPTRHHFELARTVLDHGAHLFVEKPLTPASTEAHRLCELAEHRQRVLQVGHSERFNGAWLAARPHLTSARRIRAVRQSGFPSRSLDIGVVLDLMIHEIDLVLSLTSAPIIDVAAHATTVVGPHEDIVAARLEFADGLVADLESSRVSPNRQRRWEVVTRTGLIELDLADGTAATALADASFPRVASQIASAPYDERRRFAEELFQRWMPSTPLAVAQVNALVAEHTEFIGAIEGKRRVTVDGEAGRRAVEVAERILAAAGEPDRLLPDANRTMREAA